MIHLSPRKLYPVLFLFLFSCAYNDLSESFDCTQSDLSITLESKQDVSGCKAIDGKLKVSPFGGMGPYDFSLNGGTFQTNPEFINLGPGSYNVRVKDSRNCEASVQIDVNATNSTLDGTVNAAEDNQCSSNNGSVTVTGKGGVAPYQYQLGVAGFGSINIFSNLASGQYTIIVKDATDCQKTISVAVPRGITGVSYKNDIKPILDASCNLSGCHNAGTGTRDWTTYEKVNSNAGNIKARTANKSMPIGGLTLTQTEIDKIACWVDDGSANN